jgi:hypothetical protein
MTRSYTKEVDTILDLHSNRFMKGSDLKKFSWIWVTVTGYGVTWPGYKITIGENIDTSYDAWDNPRSKLNLFPIQNIYYYQMSYPFWDGFHIVEFSDDEQIYIDFRQCYAKRLIIGNLIKPYYRIDSLITWIINNKLTHNCILFDFYKNEFINNNSTFRYFPDEIKESLDFCKFAIKENSNIFPLMLHKIKTDLEFCKYAIEIDPKTHNSMTRTIKKHPEIESLIAMSDTMNNSAPINKKIHKIDIITIEDPKLRKKIIKNTRVFNVPNRRLKNPPDVQEIKEELE